MGFHLLMQKMVIWALLAVLIISTLSAVNGKEVNLRGEDGNKLGNGSVPTIDLGRGLFSNPADPSQYLSPNPPSKPDNESNATQGTAESYDNVSASLMTTFKMTSYVKGTSDSEKHTRFSEWRVIDDGMYQKAKQTSSAPEGRLEEDRIIGYGTLFTGSTELNSTARSELVLKDQVSFQGRDYNERSAYLNNDELIRNSFQSTSLDKNSRYAGVFDGYLYDEFFNDELTAAHFNMSNSFALEAKNEGKITLDMIAGLHGNYRDLSQEYIGSFDISITTNSTNNSALKRDEDAWLPCCSEGNETLPIYSEINSRWVRPNATQVFDCTCSNLQSKDI